MGIPGLGYSLWVLDNGNESMLKSYRELIVWQKSIKLVVAVYELTEKFPRSELYGLTS